MTYRVSASNGYSEVFKSKADAYDKATELASDGAKHVKVEATVFEFGLAHLVALAQHFEHQMELMEKNLEWLKQAHEDPPVSDSAYLYGQMVAFREAAKKIRDMIGES